MDYILHPSPLRPGYLRSQRLNPSEPLTYSEKVYGTTFKPAAWPAAAAGNYYELLNEAADGKLLLEDGTSYLQLETSDSIAYSLIYLFSSLEPILYGGVATDTVTGSSVTGLALAFPVKFFKAGHRMTFEIYGKITANSINSSLSFTIKFPHTGSAATLSMPTTVGANKLSDWGLRLISSFGYDSNGNGTVTHTGSLTVTNSDATSGESTSLAVAVQNTLDYNTILYYLPTVSWTTQDAGNTVDFYSASLIVA